MTDEAQRENLSRKPRLRYRPLWGWLCYGSGLAWFAVTAEEAYEGWRRMHTTHMRSLIAHPRTFTGI